MIGKQNQADTEQTSQKSFPSRMPTLKPPHDERGRFKSPYPQTEPLLKKSLGLRLPSSAYEKAVALAHKRGISLSKLLREAALAGLKQIEEQEEKIS
jgi:hypothetical protein